MKMFSVYDSAAAAYSNPLYYRTAEEASRAFRSSLKEPNNPIAQYPEHFTLVEVGSFDVITGTISSLPQPHILGSAAALAQIA